MKLKCYYRLCDKAAFGKGYNWKICFENFVKYFSPNENELKVYIDNSEQTTIDFITNFCKDKNYEFKITEDGNALGFYNVSLDSINENSDDTVIYFVESDYIHRENSKSAMVEIFSLFANNHYVTLYDHPDKYYPFLWDSNYKRYINHCELEKNKNFLSRIFFTQHGWWRTTPSTCWTFAATRKTLKEDFEVIEKWTKPFVGGKAKDHEMFDELTSRRFLFSPIPSYSAHTALFPSGVDWSKYT